MIINRKQVKQMVKDGGKQCSKEYLERLEYKVKEMVDRSIVCARHFKRLTPSELL